MTGPNPQLARAKYRRLARRYDRLAPFTHPLRRRAIGRLGLRPGDTVVDVACGTGLSFALIEKAIGPTGNLIGLDLSSDMLAVARERVRGQGWENVTLIESTVEEASVPAPLDAALFVLSHDVMQSPAALANVTDRLRRGGRIAAAGHRRVARPLAERYVTTHAGIEQPWRHLSALVPELQVESVFLGVAYVAWGAARA